MANTVFCQKLQKNLVGLEKAPLPGELGEKILANISQQAWQEWLSHQTILINEYRLSLAKAESRKFLAEEMRKFLFGSGSQLPDQFKSPDDRA